MGQQRDELTSRARTEKLQQGRRRSQSLKVVAGNFLSHHFTAKMPASNQIMVYIHEALEKEKEDKAVDTSEQTIKKELKRGLKHMTTHTKVRNPGSFANCTK